MAAIPARAAAYTRTGILKRFLDELAESPPARVDSGFAAQRLELKGGDIRAFLQSVRVLGLVDSAYALTERGRRTRGLSQRGPAIREALADAYPELVARWQSEGVMTRQEVEDFFKVEYGLSTSSAAPAAKLFMDLVQEYGPLAAPPAGPAGPTIGPAASPSARIAARPAETALAPMPPSPELRPASAPVPSAAPEAQPDVRVAALETIKSSLKIDITADWDRERIELVFDRMERLVDRIVGGV